jgi:hypothetical protein
MGSLGREQLKPWAIGTLVLLLAHGLGSPRSAWAGCSHLVSSRSDRLLEFNRLDDLLTSGSSFWVSDNPDQDPPREPGPQRPTPCSGPGCSSRIPLPVPTASQGSGGSDQWVVLSAVPSLPVVSPSSRTFDEPATRPAGHKPSIFHPPPA